MEVQISFGDDGSWKQRCDEKLKKLKEKNFTSKEDALQQLRQLKRRYASDDIIMDPDIYEAVKKDDPDDFVDAFQDVCEEEKLSFDDIIKQSSHGGDSLLHVAAKYGSDKIAELVAFHEPSLLEQENIKGNIPLHDAAQSNEGGSKVIEVIFSRYDALKNTSTRTEDSSNTSARTNENSNTSTGTEEALTRWKNRVGNTALHEAVACGNLHGVKKLYRRDKAAAHELNNANKSPLYVAVYNYMRWNNFVKPNQRQEMNNNAKAIVDYLLQDSLLATMPDSKWKGGKSPLRAAIEAVSDEKEEQSSVSINVEKLHRCCNRATADQRALLKALVEKRPEMIYIKDEHGRIPLHYAALCGYLDGVHVMLENYPLAALEVDVYGDYPIHLACKFGKIDVVKALCLHRPTRPYVGGLLNQKGQNILHVAAKEGKYDVVHYILKSKGMDINLNETDSDGNTPLHLASQIMDHMVLFYLTRDQRIDLQCQNSKCLTARDIVLMESGPTLSYRETLSDAILSSANAIHSESWRLKKLQPTYDDLNQMKDLVNTLMLVAILIATMTFAAGFTVPGSVYSSDDPDPQQRGVAVLAKAMVFQIFMVCNTAAMYSSTVASFLLLWAQRGDYHLARNAFGFAIHMVAWALMTMSGAFMAAAYLIVHDVHWLTILIRVIGAIAIIFILSAYIFFIFPFHYPLLRPASNFFFRILIPFAGNETPEKKMAETSDSQKGDIDKKVEQFVETLKKRLLHEPCRDGM